MGVLALDVYKDLICNKICADSPFDDIILIPFNLYEFVHDFIS